MDPVIVGVLAAKVAERGPTFLGEDLAGWRTALIAAIPAAAIYEVTTMLIGRVTLRLPFLVLQFAGIFMPNEDWKRHYPEWKAELWFILQQRDLPWFIRFTNGMRYALPLACGGARLTAKASLESSSRRRALMVGRSFAITCALIIVATQTATIGMFLM